MKTTYKCNQCKESYPEDEMRFTNTHEEVCLVCFLKDEDQKLFTCEECEEQFHESEKADCDYEALCQPCFQEHILTLER